VLPHPLRQLALRLPLDSGRTLVELPCRRAELRVGSSSLGCPSRNPRAWR